MKQDGRVMDPSAFGPPKLLTSGRIGRQVATNRCGKPVFIDTNGLTCCEHGERHPSITSWINSARANPSFQRPSPCTCENVDGLMTNYEVDTLDLPPADIPLYKLLTAMGNEEKMVNTRPQRIALKTPTCELWIQPSGTIVCPHGNSRKVLGRMRKEATRFRSNGVVKCNCMMNIPRRVGSVFAGGKVH
jgi:hypothetical protein